jgi:nucleoid-associated protein YgaU
MRRYLAEAESVPASNRSANRNYGRIGYLLPVLILFLLAGWYANELSGKYFSPGTTERGEPLSAADGDIISTSSQPTGASQPSSATDTHSIKDIRKISPVPENLPVPSAAPRHREAAVTAADPSGIRLKLVEQLKKEVSRDVVVSSDKGGIFIEGYVDFPWQKQELERKARGWECDFIDFTGLRVKSPNAFQYRIKKGDNLSTLAKHFLGRQSLWPVLYEANRELLSSPDKLQIGQQIVVLTETPTADQYN